MTAEAFVVLPPVANLSTDEAIEIFLLGYTSKLAGTESGVKEPEATFSACFGAPFLPRKHSDYAALLRKKRSQWHTVLSAQHRWTGGANGKGTRIKLSDTRAILKAILNGEIEKSELRKDGNFGFAVPVELSGVPAEVLNPRKSWNDEAAYVGAAAILVRLFKEAQGEIK